jgi:HopA1 effector protein family
MATPGLSPEELSAKLQAQERRDPAGLRLVRFLKLVWRYTEGGTTLFSEQTIYDLYSGLLPPRLIIETAPSDGPFLELQNSYIEKCRKQSLICNQGRQPADWMFSQVTNHNLEFHAPCLDAGLNITDRIYINVKMIHALEVMTYVVEELVLPGAGVVYAKIACPLQLCLPVFDRIVIYCGGRDVAKVVAVKLVSIFPSTYFNLETPAMTEILGPGICTGAEPRANKKQESFGSKRAKWIYVALTKCGGNQLLFFDLVVAYFTKFNIDPNQPHRNLPD